VRSPHRASGAVRFDVSLSALNDPQAAVTGLEVLVTGSTTPSGPIDVELWTGSRFVVLAGGKTSDPARIAQAVANGAIVLRLLSPVGANSALTVSTLEALLTTE
jgi:hypothetical protein